MRPIQPIRQPVSAWFRELLPCALLALAGALCFLCHALLYAKLAAPPPAGDLPARERFVVPNAGDKELTSTKKSP